MMMMTPESRTQYLSLCLYDGNKDEVTWQGDPQDPLAKLTWLSEQDLRLLRDVVRDRKVPDVQDQDHLQTFNLLLDNGRVGHGLNLLHAAVLNGGDPAQVQGLLNLGVNPKTRSV